MSPWPWNCQSDEEVDGEVVEVEEIGADEVARPEEEKLEDDEDVKPEEGNVHEDVKEGPEEEFGPPGGTQVGVAEDVEDVIVEREVSETDGEEAQVF